MAARRNRGSEIDFHAPKIAIAGRTRAEHPPAVVRAYLGLGGNLGDVDAAFDRATRALEARAIRVLRSARRYRTAPVGPADQPRYLNTALEVDTALEPLALLAALKAIEVE